MPAGHAGRLVWKSRAHTNGDADLPAVSYRADRDHSAESVDRARCGRGGRFARHTWNDAGTTRAMAFLQPDAIDDYLSPGVSAPKSGPFGKAASLGRYAASAGATRSADNRTAAKLFFVGALLCEAQRWRDNNGETPRRP